MKNNQHTGAFMGKTGQGCASLVIACDILKEKSIAKPCHRASKRPSKREGLWAA